MGLEFQSKSGKWWLLESALGRYERLFTNHNLNQLKPTSILCYICFMLHYIPKIYAKKSPIKNKVQINTIINT